MTHFGKIKSYDSKQGTGMLTPDTGGDALPFKRKDLQQQTPEPSVDQRFGYNTSEVNGGNKRAINLHLQQAENASLPETEAVTQQG